MNSTSHITGFRRAPRAASPDAALFICAALGGAMLAIFFAVLA